VTLSTTVPTRASAPAIPGFSDQVLVLWSMGIEAFNARRGLNGDEMLMRRAVPGIFMSTAMEMVRPTVLARVLSTCFLTTLFWLNSPANVLILEMTRPSIMVPPTVYGKTIPRPVLSVGYKSPKPTVSRVTVQK